MSFEDNIRKWVMVDNQIKKLNEEAKELRGQRNELLKTINTEVEERNLKHSTIKISDGELKFNSLRVVQPLTLRFVKECLEECIQGEENVAKIMDYIKDRREIKYVDEIKRSYV